MHGRKSHSGIFAFEDQDAEGDDATIVIPENLQEISDEELTELEETTTKLFDELYESEDPPSPDKVQTLNELAEAIEIVRSESTRREDERSQAAAAADELRNRVHGASESDDEDPDNADDSADDEAEDADGSDTASDAADAETADAEPELVTASTATPAQQRYTEPAQPRRTRRINVPLSEIRRRQPEQEAQSRLAITAASDVPRFAAGHQFDDLTELGEAYFERAKSTPISTSGLPSGPKVATIRREYDHVVSNDTSSTELDRILKEITEPEGALIAAGGWCAPSEITYSFFDITCEDGMVDLPTMGITRGGIRFPVSPSLGDIYDGTFDNTTVPWLWTEADDIDAVTGDGTKPCLRVPCPDFDERRLECYGVCVTAGNLTDNAYPENTRHILSLLQSAHFHAKNSQYIATMVALSTGPTTGGIFAHNGTAAADLPAAVGWAAVDYRIKYGMCIDSILEVVLPFWAREIIRADLALRNGVEAFAVTDAQISEFFDVRNVRVQYVNDWQIRGAGLPGGSDPSNEYPEDVDFMIYAAGTFVRGMGMTLDLGVVRDSVLNAKNDHTAAWSEECHLIARIGHESRLYTVDLCASGRTGAAHLNHCEA